MSYFTDAFHELDYGNKGYILIDDFKNEMKKYILQGNENVNNESEKILHKFLCLIKLSEGGKVYVADFIKAIQELENSSYEQNSNPESKNDHDFSPRFDDNPFINDGDNYSTVDSGLGNDLKTYADFNSSFNSGIGKQNKKFIKKIQQFDTTSNRDPINFRHSQIVSSNYDNNEEFSLPQDDTNYTFNGKRRQRSFAASDFVTCVNRKANCRKKHNMDDDAHSLSYCTPCSGSAADLFYHDSMTDIQITLEKLERSMENLQNITSDSKQSKHKHHEDNYILTGQIQSLEDKLRESQKQFEEDLSLERETARKTLAKLEKAKFEEIEYLKWSIKSKEDDLESHWKEIQALTNDNERLRYDKLRGDDKLLDLQQQMTSIESEMTRLKDFHNRELNVLINERNILFSRHSDLEDNGEMVLSSKQKPDEITRLKSENRELKRKLEECESEFLAISVQQGHTILQATSPDHSWMTEIDGYTKDEIINLLVKEKDGNFRLREYVNRILTRIIDKDPSLLEI